MLQSRIYVTLVIKFRSFKHNRNEFLYHGGLFSLKERYLKELSTIMIKFANCSVALRIRTQSEVSTV